MTIVFALQENGLGFLNGLAGVLLSIAPFVGLCCLVAAGLALRGEGGINFEIGGNFSRLLLWALIFIALPTVPVFMSNVLGVPGITNSFTSSSTVFGGMTNAVSTFVNSYLLRLVVPSLAGFLIVKAVLDSGQGESPLPSLVSAVFLLSVQGIYSMAKAWVGNDGYSIATGLANALSYLSSTLCPVGASFCFIGAVVQFIKGGAWGQLVLTGLAMLCCTGIIALVKSWG